MKEQYIALFDQHLCDSYLKRKCRIERRNIMVTMVINTNPQCHLYK